MASAAAVAEESFLAQIAGDTAGFSVADLVSMCREAAMAAIRKRIAGAGDGEVGTACVCAFACLRLESVLTWYMGGCRQVTPEDVRHAMAMVPPSLIATKIEHPPRPWQLSAGQTQ
eukprot:1679807-Rhodomonas_salina.6